MTQNGTGRAIKTVLLDSEKELVAGMMRGFCEQQGTWIISSVPYSPSSNGAAERRLLAPYCAIRTFRHASGLGQCQHYIPAERDAHKGERRSNAV
jgi:hypothetical protein